MAITYSGHDPSNDNLINGIGVTPGQTLYDPTAYAGTGGVIGPDGSQILPGSRGYEQEANRYQQMGADAYGRAAPTIDYTAANVDRENAGYARNDQGEALGLMRSAAYGAQPSQAELLGHKMIDDSLNAQMAGAAGARGGPMQQAAAMRQAQGNAAQFQAQGNQGIAAMRADEMARARGEFMGGASAMRGQDYQGAGQAAGMAQAQTGVEMQQRGMNQQSQQYYEGLRRGVYQDTQNAGMANAGMDEAKRQFMIGQQNQRDAQANALVGGIAGGVGGIISKVGTSGGDDPNKGSDARMKQDTFPMGREAPMGQLDPWLPPNTFPSMALISDPRAKREERMLGQAEGMMQGYKAALERPSATQPALDRSAYRQTPSSLAEGERGFVKDPTTGQTRAVVGHGDHVTYADDLPARAGGIVRDDPYAPQPVAMSGDIDRRDPYAAQPADPRSGALARGLGAGLQNFGGAMVDANRSAAMAPPQYTVPQPGIMQISDARAKRDAWDEGRRAAISDFEKLSTMPEERRRELVMGDDPDKARAAMAANAMRASAYYGNVPLTKPRPMQTFARDKAPEQLDREASRPAEAAPAQMMDAIGSGISYRYKDGVGEDAAKRHYGTTTQDLKQTPMGASMVEPHPSGFDGINVKEAVGPTLASLGNLNERLRMLEEQRRRGGR